MLHYPTQSRDVSDEKMIYTIQWDHVHWSHNKCLLYFTFFDLCANGLNEEAMLWWKIDAAAAAEVDIKHKLIRILVCAHTHTHSAQPNTDIHPILFRFNFSLHNINIPCTRIVCMPYRQIPKMNLKDRKREKNSNDLACLRIDRLVEWPITHSFVRSFIHRCVLAGILSCLLTHFKRLHFAFAFAFRWLVLQSVAHTHFK